MADEERRAEIEAVARALWLKRWPGGDEDAWRAYGRPGQWLWEDARTAIAALDRVRDARGDDEAAVWRSMLGRIRVHGASGLWTGEDCAIGAVAALEGGDAGRAFMLEREAARSSPCGDHEAGIEAGARATNPAYDAATHDSTRLAWRRQFEAGLNAYLDHVSPSRDGTVAVEDVERWLETRAQTVHGPGAEKIADTFRAFLAEFGGES